MLDFLKKKNASPQEKLPTDEVLLSEKYYQEGLAKLQDLIAPAAVKITPRYIRVGETLAQTIFVITYPRYLHSNWFSPIINIDMPMDISMFVHPIDTNTILKNLRKTATQVQSQIHIESERGMVRDPVLETALGDIEGLRDMLQQGTEKLFRLGLYITIIGKSEKELNDIENEIRSLLETKIIYLKSATFQQEEGFNATLPLQSDKLYLTNLLNTSPLSSSFPFVSSDLNSNKGILYGINRHNNSLILFDRFSLENANSVIFAKSGAGKSYAVKLEILRSLMLGADIIVIDPENEYQYLTEVVGGSYIKIALNSPHHLNPFDLPEPGKDEKPADVLRSNISTLVGLLRILLGGLTPGEDALLDKAISQTYASRDITPDSDFSQKIMPTMANLKTVLENTEGGRDLAIRIEKYSHGTYANFFNNQTNVQLGNKLIVFSIRDMEEELRPAAMYIVLHYIWNIVRKELKKRILVVDEAWWIMKNEDGASFLYGIAKRARKYYLGLATITQDVGDFLNSPYGKPLITNSSIQILLRQSPASIDILKQTFNLTDEEKFLLLESDVGEGLFFAGLKHVAIKILASYTEDQLITSDPAQLLAIKKAKEDFSLPDRQAGAQGEQVSQK